MRETTREQPKHARRLELDKLVILTTEAHVINSEQHVLLVGSASTGCVRASLSLGRKVAPCRLFAVTLLLLSLEASSLLPLLVSLLAFASRVVDRFSQAFECTRTQLADRKFRSKRLDRLRATAGCATDHGEKKRLQC